MNARDIMIKKGIRPTQFREEVLGVLLREGQPLSHAQISSAIGGAIDRVTLYRTLELFADRSIVHQVQGPDGAWRFCAHDTSSVHCPGNHPHFLCLSCKRMICLTDQSLPRVEVPEGLVVEGKQLVVYGLCADCARKVNERKA